MSIDHLLRFLADESGPTAAEYAVMLALIIFATIGIVRTLGSGNASMWDNNVDQLGTAMGS